MNALCSQSSQDPPAGAREERQGEKAQGKVGEKEKGEKSRENRGREGKTEK